MLKASNSRCYCSLLSNKEMEGRETAMNDVDELDVNDDAVDEI